MKKILFMTMLAYMLASCGSKNILKEPALYTWYDTENATYQYLKKNTEEDLAKAMEQYKLVVESPNGARKIAPPGMYAEYGYLLVKSGQIEEGLTLLNAEIENYPMSKVYISRIIKQLGK